MADKTDKHHGKWVHIKSKEDSIRTRGMDAGMFFMLFFYCLAGIIGMPEALISGFGIPAVRTELYITLTIAALLLLLPFKGKRHLRYLLPIYGIGYGIWWVFRSRHIIGSISICLQPVLGSINHYTEQNISIGDGIPPEFRTGRTEGLAAVFLILSFLFVVSACISRIRIIGFTLLAGSFLLPFLMGEVPGVASVCLITVSAVGIYATQKSGWRTGGAVGGTVLVMLGLAAVIGTALLEKPIRAQFEGKDKAALILKDFLEDPMAYLGNSYNAGVGDGDLGAGRFRPSSEPQLQVTLDSQPDSPLYIQGYIGTSYTGERWEPADKLPKEAQNYDSAYTSGGGMYTMDIKVLTANPDFKYVPYGIMGDDELGRVADTYLKGDGSKEYRYDFAFVSEFLRAGSGNYLQYHAPSSPYEEYILDEYTKVPKHIRKAFQSEVDGYNASGSQRDVSYISYVARRLSAETSYSPNPGKVPRGKDYAEYFFFQNKKGFCMHYATTAALMIRMRNIPSRFVSGFIVWPEQFEEQKDGSYRADVTGDNAHAWAEVYENQRGWVPVETTPGYSQSADEAKAIQTPQTTAKDPAQEAEQPPEEKPKEEPKKEQGTDNSKTSKDSTLLTSKIKYTPVIAAVIFLLIMIAALILLAYKARRLKMYTGKTRNEKAISLYHKLDLLLETSGIKMTEYSKEMLVQNIRKACTAITPEECADFIRIIETANFAGRQITTEEFSMVRKVYEKSLLSIWPYLSILKKLKVIAAS